MSRAQKSKITVTHYDDLTPYEYGDPPPRGGVNVGWLSDKHPFPKGDPPAGLVEALAKLADRPENLYRGYHLCELCPSVEEAERSTRRNDLFLGNGEIHIRKNGTVYVAPTLVVHYVERHGYRPPDEFVIAALDAAAKPNRS
jgi:hypothetical protein